MGIKNEKANFDPLLIAEQTPVSLLSPSSELRQENQKIVENHKSTNVFDPEALFVAQAGTTCGASWQLILPRIISS